jgi:diguanylate cyclase (GGDEF)-like protein
LKVDQLRLDKVEALLAQAGLVMPKCDAGQETAYLQALLDALCDLSTRDALTGVLNRRSLMMALEQELDRVARSGDAALLLVVDIDHFKRINDTHGHLAGDAVIRAVSQALQDCVRPMDSVGRFGGEEFAVVLPSCPVAFAAVVGERIRARVEALRIAYPGEPAMSVTVSCGGAFAPPWVRSTPMACVGRPDGQKYRAKAAGRNAVCIEPQLVSEVSAEEKGLLFGLTAPDTLIIGDTASK